MYKTYITDFIISNDVDVENKLKILLTTNFFLENN